MENNNSVSSPRIHWTIALVPLALQVLVIKEFGSDALDGASQTVLLVAVAVAVAMGMLFFKVPWRQIDHAIADNVKTISGAILILFLIGAVAGSWMLSGVVPTMIYYGMQIVDPSGFLFVASRAPITVTRFHHSPTPRCWPHRWAKCHFSSISSICLSPRFRRSPLR